MYPKIIAAVLTLLTILLVFASLALPEGFLARPAGQDMVDPASELARGSALPVLSIHTGDTALPGDEDSDALLTVYEYRDGQLRAQSAPIEIRERGNTSRRFPKKSYRVKIVDEYGEKDNLSLLGLRSDDDWILNPMYADTSKIREALAYGLWDMINSSSDYAASSRVEYAEVFINGKYWGLYGVQERIDRKQVDGDKRSGILYKVIANDRPTPEELLSCESSEVCRGIELAFSGAGVEEPWEPAAAYISLLSGEPCDISTTLSLENTIDYGLWAMLCQAHDCHFKNQFLNCVYANGSYTMYKIPWDLNNTFGDVWDNDAAEANHTGYRVGGLVTDGAFGVLTGYDDPAVNAAIRERWNELRAGFVTVENLIKMAHELYAPLTEAIARDSARWPECGMGNGNAVNIRDIEGFFREIIPRMDEYIDGL